MAVPVGRTRRGRVTIEVLDLNRDELAKRRRTRRAHLLGLQRSRDILAAHAVTAEELDHLAYLNQLLDEAISDAAEYAAMARVTLS